MVLHINIPPVKQSLPWKKAIAKVAFNWRTMAFGFIAGAYILDVITTKRAGDPRQKIYFRSSTPTRYVYDK